MFERDFFDSLAANATVSFGQLAERLFGPGVHNAVFGPVTWGDVGVFLCCVAIVLLVHAVAAAFLRRKARLHEDEKGPANWRSQIFYVLSKPLYFLIWVFGIYIASRPLLVKLPAEPPHFLRQLFDKLFDLGVFVFVFWIFFRLTRVAEARLRHWASKSEGKFDDIFVALLGKTSRVIVPVIAVILALPVMDLPMAYDEILTRGSSLLIIGAVSWILFQAVGSAEKMLLSKYDITVADNLQARKIHTQVRVITKTLHVVIGIFAVASALMLFEEVRRFGTSILASAGVVGIIVGFAAQKTIANLFAGFQLAMTQPIRLDDVVIVEGEWGRVEELTLTYVVIHIWDDRRLVVPLSYFIEKPFQNWTRVTTQLLGSVFFWVDYTLPISELRHQVQVIVESCADWDKRFWNLQVTDTSERAMQVRVLATASDSGKAWNLRCEIREKLLALIQQRYPQSLPRFRAETNGTSLAMRGPHNG